MFAKLHLLSQDQPEAGRAGDTGAAPYRGSDRHVPAEAAQNDHGSVRYPASEGVC